MSTELVEKLARVSKALSLHTDQELAAFVGISRTTLDAIRSEKTTRTNSATVNKIENAVAKAERQARGYGQESIDRKRERLMHAIGMMSDQGIDEHFDTIMRCVRADMAAEFGSAPPTPPDDGIQDVGHVY